MKRYTTSSHSVHFEYYYGESVQPPCKLLALQTPFSWKMVTLGMIICFKMFYVPPPTTASLVHQVASDGRTVLRNNGVHFVTSPAVNLSIL